MFDISQRLKALRSEKKKRGERVRALNDEISRIRSDVKTENDHIEKLNNEISDLTTSNKEVVVTEHAMLRYLERVKGLDLEDVRDEIESDKLRAMISQFGGNGRFTVDGKNYRVKNYSVITVTD